ncbi:MAG: S9 family peptidase [Myxococcales bacterium FL481]|nr:MAG: S9 family peptidase [Myxococcales bacterium FL481]
MSCWRWIAVSTLVAGLGACRQSATPEAPTHDATPAVIPDVPSPPAAPAYTYPATQTVNQVDNYHGIDVPDPYRWLEDLDAAETKAWVAAQNDLTFGELAKIAERQAIANKLARVWNHERYSAPENKGGRYFFRRNNGLQDQDVLYWSDGIDGQARVLIDPNTLSTDGTVALRGVAIRDDGKYVAYGVSASGSDWETWRVREVATGTDLPDTLEWVKFSRASWSKDGKGFYYSRYAAPEAGEAYEAVNDNQKLYYHPLGTDQATDRLVYERPDQPEWGFRAKVSDDGRYLVVSISQGTDRRKRVYVSDLRRSRGPMQPLLDAFDASYTYLGNEGPVFWFKTDLNAPRGRVVAIDLRRPSPQHWRELVPQSEDTLKTARVVGDRFVLSYLHHAHSRVVIHRTDGAIDREVRLPGIGSTTGFVGSRRSSETFFGFSSFATPKTIYRLDVNEGQPSVFHRPSVPFDPSRYETTQVFLTSKDGTRIPMFITAAKGQARSGDAPTYLYGYGGFNIALTPKFTVPDAVWLEMGGIYAQPSLRGGGEYGERWHEAGTKLNKQNVFDDFAAAARFLIDERYTSSDRLAIGGRSNGGLLVGASITQHPELFGAALAGVGVMDMLRFHKFTIGWAWVSDYGSADDARQFQALYAYSPLHNVRSGTAYPATLVYAADHDDRVVPSHSYKFAAALQAAQAGTEPILMRIDTKAGHGAGKPVSKRIDEWADYWAFLVAELDFTLPAGFAG